MNAFKPLFMILLIWLMHLAMLVVLVFLLGPVAHSLAIASHLKVFDTLAFVDGLTFLVWGILSGPWESRLYQKATQLFCYLLFAWTCLSIFTSQPNLLEPLIFLVCVPLGFFLSPFVYERIDQFTHTLRGSGKAGEN